MNPLIYVIDDDEKIREIISRYLLSEGYRVHAFGNGADALEKLSVELPDLVVLDVMMPGQDGYDVCKRIRATSDLPIIFVSARNQELDRILGLELGGDDYLSKPFSPRELVARIKSVLRRVRTPHESLDLMRIGDLSIYPEARRVQSKGVDMELTTKEYDFLKFLAENLNKAFTREQLMNRV
jgi:DNA-binding response OmpR family regulator